MAYLSLLPLIVLGLALGAQAAPLPGHPARDGAARHLYLPVASPELPNEGRIVETIDAGNYTYVRVAKENGSQWLAILKAPLRAGMTIRYGDGLLMKNFHSKSLKRTFESIMFLERVELVREQANQ